MEGHLKMDGPHVSNIDSNSLIKAVYLSRLRLTRLLLEGGAYINESNEHGETPLMVACKTSHTDNQSVSKCKMVGYLLESGADPNIQDKSGKTALMHACLEKAGPEVVSLLLASGADPCLEDHAGSSALIYAINTSDEKALELLIEACKVQGKEVIIITPEKLACGMQVVKQNVPIPSPAMVDQWDKSHSSKAPCASPSDIHLSTWSQDSLVSSSHAEFSHQSMTSSQPTSPTRQPSSLVRNRVHKLHNLQRLYSEPWLKIPPSFLAQQNDKRTSQTEELPDITPEEERSIQMKRQAFGNTPLSRHCSMDLKEAAGLNQTISHKNGSTFGESLRPEGALCRNVSFDGLSSLHSLSHPNLHAKSGVDALPADKAQDKSMPNLAVSSLRNIIQRRKLGMDHYSSDSQLSRDQEDSKGQDKKKLYSQSPNLLGSRESLELIHMSRKNPNNYERRGSGALLLDSSFHPRAGVLPPINPGVKVPSMTSSGSSVVTCSDSKGVCGIVGGTKSCFPSAPAGFPKDHKTRRMLMRRHSMQTEQLKGIRDITEIFGH